MKNTICFKISSLLLVVSLLSQSWAMAAPGRPGPEDSTENGAEQTPAQTPPTDEGSERALPPGSEAAEATAAPLPEIRVGEPAAVEEVAKLPYFDLAYPKDVRKTISEAILDSYNHVDGPQKTIVDTPSLLNTYLALEEGLFNRIENFENVLAQLVKARASQDVINSYALGIRLSKSLLAQVQSDITLLNGYIKGGVNTNPLSADAPSNVFRPQLFDFFKSHFDSLFMFYQNTGYLGSYKPAYFALNKNFAKFSLQEKIQYLQSLQQIIFDLTDKIKTEYNRNHGVKKHEQNPEQKALINTLQEVNRFSATELSGMILGLTSGQIESISVEQAKNLTDKTMQAATRFIKAYTAYASSLLVHSAFLEEVEKNRPAKGVLEKLDSYLGGMGSKMQNFYYAMAAKVGALSKIEEESKAAVETYDESAPEAEKLEARKRILAEFYKNVSVINNIDSLISVSLVIRDMGKFHAEKYERLIKSLTERIAKQGDESSEITRLTLAQAKLSLEAVRATIATGEADLQILKELKAEGANFKLIFSQDKNGNPRISASNPIFQQFVQRLYSNNATIVDAQDSSDEIYKHRRVLLDNPILKALNYTDALKELLALRASVYGLLSRMAAHSKKPYFAKSLIQPWKDAQLVAKRLTTRIAEVKAEIRKNKKILSQSPEDRLKLSREYEGNFTMFLQATNIFIRDLGVAAHADEKQSQFLAKVRVTFPSPEKQAEKRAENIDKLPGLVKKDIQRILNIPSDVMGSIKRTPKAIADIARSVWNYVTDIKVSPVATIVSTETTPQTDAAATETTKTPEVPKETILVDKDISHLALDLWDAINKVWGVNLRKEKKYFDYSDAKTGELVKSVKVTLTTPGVEAKEISISDLQRLMMRMYDPNTEGSTRDVVLNLKGSSIARTDSIKAQHASVKELAYLDGGKRRIIQLTAANGEQATIDYKVDPEIATKSSSPLALTPLAKNLRQSLHHGIVKFPIDAPPFYLGLLANTWVNFMTRYESDPKAFERFFRELTSLAGQIGFVGFMVGSSFGSTLMRELNGIKNERDLALRSTRLKLWIQNFAMAMGSVFSNITHDLIAVTAPCATARWNLSFNDEMNEDEALAPCQAAWDATINSEKIHQYIQMALTVMAASFSATAMQAMASGAVKLGSHMSATFGGIALVFKDYWQYSKFLNYQILPNTIARYGALKWVKNAFMPMTPGGIILTSAHLILFFQADARANPHIHKIEETYFNTGLELANVRDGLLRNERNLRKSNYADRCDAQTNKSNAIISENSKDLNWKSYIPLGNNIGRSMENLEAKSTSDAYACREIPEQLKDFQASHQKWRDTLLYKFNMAYSSWQEFFSEYLAQIDVSKKFYSDLFFYAWNDPRSDDSLKQYFNPLFQDDPFYGVIPQPKEEPTEESKEQIFKSQGFEQADQISKIGNEGDAKDEMPGTTQIIRLQNNPNEGEIQYSNQSPETLASQTTPPFIQRVELEDAKIKRLLLAAQLIERHVNDLNNYIYSKVKMGNIETTVMLANRSAALDYIKSIQTIRAKFLSYNPQTRDFKSLIEGIELLNTTYDKYRRVYLKEIIGDAGTTQVRNITRDQAIIRNSILNLKRFVGKPRPLKKGEAFIVRFDDWVEHSYKDYVEILARKGVNKVSDAMMWNAFCGVSAHSASASEKRSAALMPFEYRISLPWKSGTGIDFLAPKIIDPYFDSIIQSGKLGFKCNDTRFLIGTQKDVQFALDMSRPIIVTAPNTVGARKSPMQQSVKRYAHEGSETPLFGKPVAAGTWETRTYDNALTFLMENTDKTVFDMNDGISMNTWWSENINPKIDAAYKEYEASYFQLVNSDFAGAMYTKGQDGRPYSIDQLFNRTLQRTAYNLPNSVSLSYMDELSMYLGVLKNVFKTEHEKKREDLIQMKMAMIGKGLLTSRVAPYDLLQQLRSSKSLAQAMHRLVFAKDLAQQNFEKTKEGIYINNMAQILDADAIKFDSHLEHLKEGLVQMLNSLVNTLQGGRIYTAEDQLKALVTGSKLDSLSIMKKRIPVPNTRCIGLANTFGPTLVHFKEVLKAVGLDTNQTANMLYQLLNMKKYGYAESDNAASMFENVMVAEKQLANKDVTLDKDVAADELESCKQQIFVGEQYDQYEKSLLYDVNASGEYEPNVSSYKKWELEIQLPEISSLLQQYTEQFASSLKTAVENKTEEAFYSNLKLDAAEKHKAEIVYSATHSIFATLASAFNQVMVFKTATQRQNTNEAGQTKGPNQDIGVPGNTPLSGGG